MKSIILAKKSAKPSSKTHDTNNKKSNKFTKAMLHDLLNALADNKEESNSQEADNSASDQEASDSTLLVNSSICKDVSPADVRKLMSMPSSKKPPDKLREKKKGIN